MPILKNRKSLDLSEKPIEEESANFQPSLAVSYGAQRYTHKTKQSAAKPSLVEKFQENFERPKSIAEAILKKRKSVEPQEIIEEFNFDLDPEAAELEAAKNELYIDLEPTQDFSEPKSLAQKILSKRKQ